MVKMTLITRRVRKLGKKSQGGNPIQKCPPKGIWTGQGGRPISRRKKAKNSKKKERKRQNESNRYNPTAYCASKAGTGARKWNTCRPGDHRKNQRHYL
jgi:hypothetical protein